MSYSAKGNPAEYSKDEVQIDRDTATPAQNRKIVVAPHKKSKQIRSNKQALSEIAKSLKCFSEAQNKHHQKYLHEERRQEEEVRREKAEKDRQHELRLAQIFSGNMYHAGAFYFNRKHRSK